jgi:hypothetical protein
MNNNFIAHFDKNSTHAHMELDFDVLGVAQKLVKCAVH